MFLQFRRIQTGTQKEKTLTDDDHLPLFVRVHPEHLASRVSREIFARSIVLHPSDHTDGWDVFAPAAGVIIDCSQRG